MLSKPTISLCMIVKNEEKHLGKCLSSVDGLVDEIIIVDTGSTDSTLEIAERFQAKIFHFEWNNDFSAARNFSIVQATSDFILVLDADEYLNSEADLKKEITDGTDYLIVKIKNYHSNGIALFHEAIRLFKNRIGLNYYGQLHEHLNVTNNKSLVSRNSEFIIHHLGYLDETVAEKDKKKRNLEIILNETEKNPTAYNLFNLGNAYLSTHDLEKAVEMYKRSYQMKHNVTYVYSLLCRLIEALRLLKRYEESIDVALAAIKQLPLYTDLYFNLAKSYEEYGYLKDAELMYLKCIELGDVKDVSFTIEGVGGYLAYQRLAEVLIKQGKSEAAFDAIVASIQLNKRFSGSLKTYFSIMMKSNITNDDVLTHLTEMFPFDSADDIKALFLALYETRHPLLQHYISLNEKADFDHKIKAVAKLYNKQYEASRLEWKQSENVNETNGLDILLLALFLHDEDLLKKCESLFNASKKEWAFIRKFVTQQEIASYKPTSWLENTLLNVIEKTLFLQEFELFEQLSGYIVSGTNGSQLALAKILVDYRYYDVAFELLMQLASKDPQNVDVLLLQGDIYAVTGHLTESKACYQRAAEISKEIKILEKLYDLYGKSHDNKLQEQVKQTSAQQFPLCWWAKQADR